MRDSLSSAVELAASIRRGERNPVDVVDECLDRIDSRNHETNAIVTVTAEDARTRAKEAQRALRNGESIGPLHGVPVVIKDLFDFKTGTRNTFGAQPLADYVSEQTSEPVRRLEAAGAIVVGKTNTPEFGHKGTTDNPVFGPTSTPFDLDRNSGGSSGGSAAAVSDGLVPIALGSDAAGSIRIPAAWCGVVGFKPTYGRVPRASRPDAFSSHTPFIQEGPLTRTVEDAALVTQILGGPHSRDPLSAPDDDSDLVTATKNGIEDLTIGYSPDFEVFPIDSEVRDVVDSAVDAFATAGATVERVSLDFNHSRDELEELILQELSIVTRSGFAGFEQAGIDLLGEHREELSPELVELVERTEGLSAFEYKLGDHARTDIYDNVQNILDSYDILVTPTVAVPPVKNKKDGQTLGPSTVNGEPVDPLIGWCLTYPLNFTGHPAASVPAGFTSADLPVGLQIVGNRFEDGTVLRACAGYERVRPWQDKFPH